MSTTARRRLAAERTRRWRARAAAGCLVAQTEVSVAVAQMLVAAGVLDPLRDDDREAVGEALRHFLETLAADRNGV